MSGSDADVAAVTLRRATVDDLDDLTRLESQAFDNAWTRKSLEEELQREAGQLWLAEGRGEVQGYACFLSLLDEAELLRIAVLPILRQRGLGRRLLVHGLHHLERQGCTVCHLEVRADNRAARRLYESLGFSVSGRRKGYYRASDTAPAVDAVLYQRPLPHSG